MTIILCVANIVEFYFCPIELVTFHKEEDYE